MELSIPERLDLLEKGGVISKQIRSATEAVLPQIEARLGRSLNTSTGQMFITHLAMALSRAQNGELLSELPKEVEAEISDEKEVIQFSRQILAGLEQQLGLKLSQAEVLLTAAYLAALKKEEELH